MIKKGVNNLKSLWDKKVEIARKLKKEGPGPGDYTLPIDNLNLVHTPASSFGKDQRVFEKMALKEIRLKQLYEQERIVSQYKTRL